jgi:hypothetical protein
MAVDINNNYYVVDTNNHRVQKYDNNGNFMISFGYYGNKDGQFNYPTAIHVDPKGYIYILDSNNSRVQKFENNGKFIYSWGKRGITGSSFNQPMGFFIDDNKNTFIADTRNNRILKFIKMKTLINFNKEEPDLLKTVPYSSESQEITPQDIYSSPAPDEFKSGKKPSLDSSIQKPQEYSVTPEETNKIDSTDTQEHDNGNQDDNNEY